MTFEKPGYDLCWLMNANAEPGEPGVCTCRADEMCWRLLRPDHCDWVIVEHREQRGHLLPGLLFSITPDTVVLYFACQTRMGLVQFNRTTGREHGPGEYRLPMSLRKVDLGEFFIPENGNQEGEKVA